MLLSRTLSLSTVWRQMSPRKTQSVVGKILACRSRAGFIFQPFQKFCDFAEMNTVGPCSNAGLQALVQWKYRNNWKSVPQLGIKVACSFTGTVSYQLRGKEKDYEH